LVSIVYAAGKLLHREGSRKLGLTHSQRYEYFTEKLRILGRKNMLKIAG
jgi:hypothetical protein